MTKLGEVTVGWRYRKSIDLAVLLHHPRLLSGRPFARSLCSG
jgi:hypothetical protein